MSFAKCSSYTLLSKYEYKANKKAIIEQLICFSLHHKYFPLFGADEFFFLIGRGFDILIFDWFYYVLESILLGIWLG
jgi:hypothetical protein